MNKNAGTVQPSLGSEREGRIWTRCLEAQTISGTDRGNSTFLWRTRASPNHPCFDSVYARPGTLSSVFAFSSAVYPTTRLYVEKKASFTRGKTKALWLCEKVDLLTKVLKSSTGDLMKKMLKSSAGQQGSSESRSQNMYNARGIPETAVEGLENSKPLFRPEQKRSEK